MHIIKHHARIPLTLINSSQAITLQTLDYYSSNANQLVATTESIEFSELQERFASTLPQGDRILDLRCGNGHGSPMFLKSEFHVGATNDSKAITATYPLAKDRQKRITRVRKYGETRKQAPQLEQRDLRDYYLDRIHAFS